MRSTALFVATVFAFALVATSCSSSPGPTPTPSSSPGPTPTPTPGTDGSAANMARLTVNLVATPRTETVRVVGFVNQGLVFRADAESSTTPWDFTGTFAQGGINQFVVDYPIGTVICLVADELYNPSTSTGEYDPNPATVPAQFVNWTGDAQGINLGTDKGDIAFTLDADRTIDANFADMNPLLVHVVGGADGTGTLLDYDVNSTPLSIPPCSRPTRGASTSPARSSPASPAGSVSGATSTTTRS